MTQVLIVSKTKMYNGACIGGLTLPDFRSVRLLNEGGGYHPADTNMKSGQLYEMTLTPVKYRIPPHIENVIITNQRLIQEGIDVEQYITKENLRNFFWNGGPKVLFGGHLQWTGNRSGYISHKGGVPGESTGFWLSDRNLAHNDKYYSYTDADGVAYRFKYVGFEPAIGVIPTGTKIRVSLAKWWAPNDADVEDRCYLQLSGWY